MAEHESYALVVARLVKATPPPLLAVVQRLVMVAEVAKTVGEPCGGCWDNACAYCQLTASLAMLEVAAKASHTEGGQGG